jgi:hypothetical protein
VAHPEAFIQYVFCYEDEKEKNKKNPSSFPSPSSNALIKQHLLI